MSNDIHASFNYIRKSDIILNATPPVYLYDAIGSPEHYYIQPGYQCREFADTFDDTKLNDEWQDEVYKAALEYLGDTSSRFVLDIGTGSGFKLLKYFSRGATLGVDRPETVGWLRHTYPDRFWCNWQDISIDGPLDLVILADVLEHVENPRELMQKALQFQPQAVVVSTPDRNLLMNGRWHGPPANPSHYREWTYPEFRAFMAEFLSIRYHFISNGTQATQCVIGEPKP